MQIAGRNQQTQSEFVTNYVLFDYFQAANQWRHQGLMEYYERVCFFARVTGHGLVRVEDFGGGVLMSPFDAGPRPVSHSVGNFEDWAHFAPINAKKIIIPEQSVMEMLNKVLEMQEPAKNKYFEDIIAQEYDERRAVPHTVAQIITLSDRRAA